MRRLVCALAILASGCVEAGSPLPALPPVSDPAGVTAVITRPRPDPTSYVYLRGEVVQPGKYQLLGPATVAQVLEAGGGRTKLADPRVVLTRRLDDGRVRRWVIEDGGTASFSVIPEDTLDVLARYDFPPGVWYLTRPEPPPIVFESDKPKASSCPCEHAGTCKGCVVLAEPM